MSETSPSKPTSGLSNWFGRDPFDSLRKELDDVLKKFGSGLGSDWHGGDNLLSLDLSETADSVDVTIDLPGFKIEDITVEAHGDRLTVRGERAEKKEEKGKTWHRTERRKGTFSRVVTLPCAVNDQAIEAQYADGVLSIHLPKVEESKDKKIEIKKG